MNKSVLFTLFLTVAGTTAPAPAQAQDELIYVAVPPCRIVDTRNAGGDRHHNNGGFLLQTTKNDYSE